MDTPGFIVFEDVTTFDVVWIRVSVGPWLEVQTGPGELEDNGTFTVERVPASSSTTQTSSISYIPIIATFIWGQWRAEFTCDYDQTSRSYNHFDFVKDSINPLFATAFRLANEFNSDAQPILSELDEGVWKLEMYTMYIDMTASYVELWAKKRVNGVETKATDSDLRDWSLGQYASVDEDEDGGEGEDQEVDSSEDESGEEGEEEDGGEGEDQEIGSSEDESDAEGEEVEEEEEHSDA